MPSELEASRLINSLTYGERRSILSLLHSAGRSPSARREPIVRLTVRKGLGGL